MTLHNKNIDFSPDEESNLKKGIDLQREHYKNANLTDKYDIMIRCIENIKGEIKQKAIAKNRKDDILRITKIIKWYKDLPITYSKKTPTGTQIRYPPRIHSQIAHNLQVAYEILIELLSILGLI